MDDLIKSLKAHLYDRVASPLFAALLLAWAAWNHRLLLALASNLEISKKFEYIDNFLYPTWKEVLGQGAAYPIVSAMFFIFIFPIPARWVYAYARSEQKKLKEIQQRIDDESPITREEARELKAAIRRADAVFEEEITKRDELIERLRQDISTVSRVKEEGSHIANANAIATARDPLPNNLDFRAIKMLRKIAAVHKGIDRSQLFPFLNDRDTLLHQFSIDELARLEMIKISPSGTWLTATAKGRAFLVDLDRVPEATPA